MYSPRRRSKSLTKSLSKSNNSTEAKSLLETSQNILSLFNKSFFHLQSIVTSLKLKILLYPVRLKNTISFNLFDNFKHTQVLLYWIQLWLFYVFPYFQIIRQHEIFSYRAFSLMSFFRFVFNEDRLNPINVTKDTSVRTTKSKQSSMEVKKSKKPRRKFFNKPNEEPMKYFNAAQVETTLIG